MHRKRKPDLRNLLKNMKHKKAIIISAVIIAAIAAAGVFVSAKKSKAKNENTSLVSASVERGSVEKTISGSGSVEPYERYEIIPLVNGEITDCPYEVGDYV